MTDSERLISALADERIKLGVDYAIVFKYQQRRVFCCETFLRHIVETAKDLGVAVDEFVTFEYTRSING